MLLLEFYKNKILPKDFIKIKNIFFHRDANKNNFFFIKNILSVPTICE